MFGTVRHPASKPALRVSAVVLAIGLLLSGCGVLGTDSGEPQAPSAPSSSVVATPSAPTATDLPTSSGTTPTTGVPTPSVQPTATGTPNGSPSDLGAPVATREATADDQKATLTVYPIRRADTLAVLHVQVTVDPDAEKGVFVLDFLSDGDSTTGDVQGTSVDGIRLIDSPRRKLYLAASDGDGHCLCSRDLKGYLQPGITYTFYATYAAPPAEATVLDVSFPNFGTISRVPVQ